jgi:MFS family permease
LCLSTHPLPPDPFDNAQGKRQIRRPGLDLAIQAEPGKQLRWRIFAYFAALGLGYLFVEIPLMQQFILFLGHPIYAFATVLFAVLVFSGLGSWMSPRVSLRGTLALLVASTLVYPLLLSPLFGLLLAQNLAVRLLASVLMLAPVGVLMGIPFPKGIVLTSKTAPELVPWAWGINGCTSVLSSILSVMIAVSFGFSWVLRSAAVAYSVAFVVINEMARPRDDEVRTR